MKWLVIAVTFLSASAFADKLYRCDFQYACAAVADLTAGCEATDGSTIYREEAHPAGDNACAIGQRLRDQICQAGQESSSFEISCWQKR
jgi:hypothetical protein